MSNDFQKNYPTRLELINDSTQRLHKGSKMKVVCETSRHMPENEFGTLSPKEQTILQTRYKHLMNSQYYNMQVNS